MDSFDQKVRDEIADGERWLAKFPAPATSPELIDRVKQAVRGELGRLESRSDGFRWAPWHGVVAAAAAIVLGMTIGWYSTTVDHGHASGGFLVSELLNDYTFEPVDESLSDLETLSAEDAWALSGVTLYEAMEDVLMDDQPDAPADMGVLAPSRSGISEDV